MKLLNRIFGLNTPEALARRKDLSALANLLADPESAEGACAVLLRLGVPAIEPTLGSAMRAWERLSRAVLTNAQDRHQHVHVLRAYAVVLKKLHSVEALPFLLDSFKYAATGMMVPKEVTNAIDKIDKEELERLSDPRYCPSFEDEIKRTRIHRQLFLHTRACRSLLEAVADAFVVMKDRSVPLLLDLLRDDRPPVRWAAKDVLIEIGGDAAKAAREALPHEPPTDYQWSMLGGSHRDPS